MATRLYNKKTDSNKYFFWKFPVVPKYSLYASHNLNTLHDTSQFLVCRFEQYRRLCWFKFATSFQFSYKTMSILLFILIKKKKSQDSDTFCKYFKINQFIILSCCKFLIHWVHGCKYKIYNMTIVWLKYISVRAFQRARRNTWGVTKQTTCTWIFFHFW